MTPLLLLDVDGVLVDFYKAPAGESFYHDGIPTVYFPGVRDRVLALMEDFEVMWATGWQEKANEVVCRDLDLPPFPVLLWPEDEFPISVPGVIGNPEWMPHWKGPWFPVLEDRPFAFVDDELGKDSVKWAEKRTAEGVSTLCLPTRAEEGLTDDHVRILKSFAEPL